MEQFEVDPRERRRQKKKDKQSKKKEYQASHDVAITKSQTSGYFHPSNEHKQPNNPFGLKLRDLQEKLNERGVTMSFTRVDEPLLTSKSVY